MTAPLRLVVFDWDGTLVDSAGAIVAAMGEAFAIHRCPAPDPAAVRRIIGLALETAVARLLPVDRTGAAPAIATSYRQVYAAARARPDDVESVVVDGAVAELDRLAAHGYLCAVATGKSRRGIARALDRTGLRRHFVACRTADDAPSKPHPGMLEQVMAAVGVEPDATVVVGDTTFDIEMARNAGTGAIGVAWGYHPLADLTAAGAARVIDRFDQLSMSVERVLTAR
jgi:phosphoglycolate phosphatase